MLIKDKKLKKMVDVSDSDCLSKKCYWARANPGSFQQGRGYRSYGDGRDKEWLCGTRNAHGCPDRETEGYNSPPVNNGNVANYLLKLNEKGGKQKKKG